MRQTLRERRDASQMEDLLDDTIENELIDNKINHLLSEIHNREKRELESMREQKKREREQIREQVKKRNKKKRERKRDRKNEQKNKYGAAPVNREPVVSKMLSDFVFGNSQNSEIEEKFEEGNDNEEARSRDRPVYEYEPEYETEEIESFQMEEASYDCRDHIDSFSKEERKECNQQIKALWRQDRIRLKQKSKTYRELKPALENPLIMMEALNRTLEMKMDFTSMSDDEMAEKDDALEKYLHLYGYNDDNASNGVFQAVFKTQAQLLYEQNQEKLKSKSMDTADWTRPHIMREVPLTTLGSLYVNDKIEKEEEKRELRKASKSTYEMGRSIKFEDTSIEDVEATFSERLGQNLGRSLEEGFADEESGFHDDILESGWIQIGIGSSNNTAADLKSCQNSSYKRCIGVLRKNFPNLLQGDKPQEVTVSVQGSGTERILTVDIQTKDESDKKRIFEVLIDDPTIASLKHMAICTTKGSRGKIGLFKDEDEKATTPNVNYMTTFRRMVDCQFSCLASNCREECMPDTKCEQCLVENCGKYTNLNDMPENPLLHA